MTAPTIRAVSLPNGGIVPALGLGTWYMGEQPARRAAEFAALRTGIETGLTLIDTAEMYGDGAAEELVGEAIAGRRDSVFLVSKVLPSNATRRGTVEACQASLRRLGTDHLDLYLLHWRGRVPLAETVAAFEDLVAGGADPRLGRQQLRRRRTSTSWPRCRAERACRPIRCSTTSPAADLSTTFCPRCRAAGMPLMAYSPVDHGRLLGHPAVRDMAATKGVTPAQLALAWVLRRP